MVFRIISDPLKNLYPDTSPLENEVDHMISHASQSVLVLTLVLICVCAPVLSL